MLTYMTCTAGPVKLSKVGGGDAAIFDYARSGPHFGADGLIIGKSQAATTGLFAGITYHTRDSGGWFLLCMRANTCKFVGITRATAATSCDFSGFLYVRALVPANKPRRNGMQESSRRCGVLAGLCTRTLVRFWDRRCAAVRVCEIIAAAAPGLLTLGPWIRPPPMTSPHLCSMYVCLSVCV